MASNSSIEWTETTWNPVTGCSKVSPGCLHCYAERMARRLQAMGQPNYVNGFNISVHENMLHRPLEWKTPRIIFVNSMSDLFHESVPLDFVLRVFDIMNQADWHTYQILTKRSTRMLELDRHLSWSSNIWMGVSVETLEYTDRIDHLRRANASVKFLSLEPLLGPIPNLDLEGIDWLLSVENRGPVRVPWTQPGSRRFETSVMNSRFRFFSSSGAE